MASQLRRAVSLKVVNALERCSFGQTNINSNHLMKNIKICETPSKYNLYLPWDNLQKYSTIDSSTSLSNRDTEDIILNVAENIDICDNIEQAGPQYDAQGIINIGFKVNLHKFCSNILHPIINNPDSFWRSNYLLEDKGEKVTVTLNFPRLSNVQQSNHYRGIILANFIANINAAIGNDVTLQCHINDWGKEYGLFKYAYNYKEYKDEILSKEGFTRFVQLYKWARKRADLDENVRNSSREELIKMNECGPDASWPMFHEYIKEDIEKLMSKFNFKFDQFTYESSYIGKRLDASLELLKRNNYSRVLENNSIVFNKEYEENHLLIAKDGLPTKLLSLIAMILESNEKRKPKRHYLIIPEKENNIQSLFSALQTDNDLEELNNIKTITYGQISDMKLKKDSLSFTSGFEAMEDRLKYILTNTAAKYYRHCPIDCGLDKVSDIIASCLVVGDLGQKRNMSYEFVFDTMTYDKKPTGSALQKFYSNLSSIPTENINDLNSIQLNKLTRSRNALNLILHLARFDEVLLKSSINYQGNFLTEYLFKLKIITETYLEECKTKKTMKSDESNLLICATKIVTHNSMKILGLKPLSHIK